jgi:drug/metabolite transporter (DMT)-like permease
VQIGYTDIWVVLLLQGVGVGMISGFSYTKAIANLGAARCFIIEALSPPLSYLAVPLSGERLDAYDLIGSLLIAVGAVLATTAAPISRPITLENTHHALSTLTAGQALLMIR